METVDLPLVQAQMDVVLRPRTRAGDSHSKRAHDQDFQLAN